MPTASYRVLTDLFEHHLHFTPTATDVAQFEADLAVVSPSLMKASLMELGVGRSRNPVGTVAWRQAIFAIYNRKVAEHAQLFPVFHCFETAIRSTLAVALEEHYRIRQWWGPMYHQYRGGPAVTTLGVIPKVAGPRLRAILLLVKDFVDNRRLDIMSYQDGYELLEHSMLGQAHQLIDTHWSLFRDRFVVSGQPMSPTAFRDKFFRVAGPRNSVYHHRSFSGMHDVYDTAQELLGCLGFSLPVVHRRIAETRCHQPPYF